MPAPDVLAEVDRALCRRYRQQPQRATLSFVGANPIDVLRFEPSEGEVTYVSLGMSQAPMTAADQVVQQPDGPRAELLLRVRDPGGRFGDVWRSLALLAAAPVVEGVVYAAGLTVDLGQPLAAGGRCTGAVLADSDVPAIMTGAGRVEVLQLCPATAAELAWSRARGSSALQQRWADQHTDLLDLDRAAADLT